MSLLEQLIKLQGIDTAIMEIEELQGDLPMKVKELTTIMSELEATIISAESKLTEIEIEIRKMQTLEQQRKDRLTSFRISSIS